MKSENKNLFTMTNDKGETMECEVILTIDSDEFKKSYIVYTDHTMNETGEFNTYASVYDPSGESLDLEAVETEDEWDMIENVLASAQKQVAKENIKPEEANS